MNYIDTIIKNKFENIISLEEYTKKLVEDKTLSIGAIENYSALYHELFMEIQHGTAEKALAIVDDLLILTK